MLNVGMPVDYLVKGGYLGGDLIVDESKKDPCWVWVVVRSTEWKGCRR